MNFLNEKVGVLKNLSLLLLVNKVFTILGFKRKFMRCFPRSFNWTVQINDGISLRTLY